MRLFKYLPRSQWQKILFGLISGALLGLCCGDKALYLKPIGTLFLNAIQMMIIPVVFTAIVCAVLSMDDMKKMRRVTLKAFALYALSMFISSIIGLTVANLIGPGKFFPQINAQAIPIGNLPTFTEMFTNIVPTNPIAAFASGNILQILVFAIMLGLCIVLAGEKAKPVKELFLGFSAVSIKLTQLIMSFAPYGIFALMACVTGEYGISAMLPLAKYILTMYCACFSVFIFFYAPTLFINGIQPLHFFKASKQVLIMAYSTASSVSTLPLTMACAEDKLKVSKPLSGFLLPLGTTMNLNGLSAYLSVAAVFVANVAGVELSYTQYFTIILTIAFTAMGAGGVPGSTLIVIGAVLHSVGLPLNMISLIASVDRINDMASTTTNVAGDLFATVLIAKSEDTPVTANADVAEI